MVVDAVLRNQSLSRKSLETGKIQGNLLEIGLDSEFEE